MADKRDPESRPPLMQTVFDNAFLLLVIGLAVPVAFYTIWGLLEIASSPPARACSRAARRWPCPTCAARARASQRMWGGECLEHPPPC